MTERNEADLQLRVTIDCAVQLMEEISSVRTQLNAMQVWLKQIRWEIEQKFSPESLLVELRRAMENSIADALEKVTVLAIQQERAAQTARQRRWRVFRFFEHGLIIGLLLSTAATALMHNPTFPMIIAPLLSGGR
jgi:hypothetical protein